MDKKILNIKNILRIIISILVIFSMLKSCSMAYNIDDIYEYAMQLNQQGVYPNVTTQIINNYNKLKTYQQLQNCVSIYVYFDGSYITLLYMNQPYKISFDNNQNIIGLPQDIPGVYIIRSNNVIGTSNSLSLTKDYGRVFGLLDLSLNTEEEIANFNWSNWYLNNKYNEPSTFQYTPNYTEIINFNNTNDVNALKIKSVVIPFDIGEIQKLRRLL